MKMLCRNVLLPGILGLVWVGVLGGSRPAPARAAEKLPSITVRATDQDYHNTPVTVEIPARMRLSAKPNEIFLLRPDRSRAPAVPCQLVAQGEKSWLMFVLPELAKGESRQFSLTRATIKGNAPDFLRARVNVAPEGDDLAITILGKLFTRYTTKSGPNKPFFYPIQLADGTSLTRHWPMKEVEGETRDHPHHRGLWFTHGSVNGVDYWSEGAKAGKTKNTGFDALVSGSVCGGFRAKTEWRAPDDSLVATDTREVQVIPLSGGSCLLDFAITIKPSSAPLVFGDTKEGMFGLRVPDSMAPARKEGGQMVNSNGEKDAALWGKPAEWVAYWGTVNGQACGIAMFDHPQNIRHPQTWHSRDYGLFAVNPFGLHDFGRGEKGAGDLTVPSEGTLTLRYRLLFYKGDPMTAAVADQYAAYAHPPQVEVR